MNINTEFLRLENTIKIEKNTDYSQSIILAENLFKVLSKFVFNDSINVFKKLINQSIIIKTYPKRIIKKGTNSQTGTQFEAIIMCLLNNRFVQFTNVEIKPVLCNCNESELLEHKLNSDHQNIWTLKNMRWRSKNVGRVRRQSRCVKNILSFTFTANYKLELLNCSVEKTLYSDTVEIIVHSNQEVDSLLTLFWDDYYRIDCENLLEFSCRNDSTFDELIENLSDFFKKETNRGLTEDNKIYLLDKIRNMFPSLDRITKETFMKSQMHNVKISFGQWIMSIVKMLKISTLEKLWVDNRIEGFIAKDVSNVLQNSGSFLLRFSERHAAIGVVLKTGNETEPWEPYTDGHLRQNNLANLLSDFSLLSQLRLSDGSFISRDGALEQYKTLEPIDEGYTKRGGNDISVNHDNDLDTIEPFDPNNNNGFNLGFDRDVEMNDDNYDLDDLLIGCQHLLDAK